MNYFVSIRRPCWQVTLDKSLDVLELASALMRIRARGDWFPVFLAFCSAGGYLETLSRDDLA